VMTASLPMFNMVNAHGLKAVPWRFDKNRPFTVDEWVEGHDRVCGYIQRYVHDRLGRWPALTGNGVNYSNFEKGEGDGGYCKRLLIPTDLKPKGLWGYNSEKGLAVTGSMFPGQLKMLQIASREHLAVAAEIKAASVALSQSQYDKMMHYSAAFLYIAWTPAKEGWDIDRDGPGMTVPVTFLSPYFRLPAVGPTWKHPYNGKDYKIGFPYTLFLPLGHPLSNPEPGDLDSLRYRDTNVFIRRYENGLILLNPTGPRGSFEDVDAAVDVDLVKEGAGHSIDLDIPETYTVELDQRYIDPDTGDFVEGTIEMPAATGKILLIEPSLE
jgi:hypothetical protein